MLGLVFRYSALADAAVTREREAARTHAESILTALMFFRGQTVGRFRILFHLAAALSAASLAEDTWSTRRVATRFRIANLDFSSWSGTPALARSATPTSSRCSRRNDKQCFFIVMEYVPGDTLEA